jgi:hypothetical protein
MYAMIFFDEQKFLPQNLRDDFFAERKFLPQNLCDDFF